MSVAYTCPYCFRPQALYPNVLSPAPAEGVYVVCPECGRVAVHRAPPSLEDDLRVWAQITAEVEVALFRRQLDRGVNL